MSETPSAASQSTTRSSESLATRSAEPDGEQSTVLADFWTLVKRLPRYVKLAAALARDSDVPRSAKAILAAGGAYAVSPIDLVPGIIPVAGQLDDLYVILMALRIAIRTSPEVTTARHLFDAGVTADDIERDLAAVRALVREGVTRGARFGGRTLTKITSSAAAFVRERRRQGDTNDDQKSIQSRP